MLIGARQFISVVIFVIIFVVVIVVVIILVVVVVVAIRPSNSINKVHLRIVEQFSFKNL